MGTQNDQAKTTEGAEKKVADQGFDDPILGHQLQRKYQLNQRLMTQIKEFSQELNPKENNSQDINCQETRSQAGISSVKNQSGSSSNTPPSNILIRSLNSKRELLNDMMSKQKQKKINIINRSLSLIVNYSEKLKKGMGEIEQNCMLPLARAPSRPLFPPAPSPLLFRPALSRAPPACPPLSRHSKQTYPHPPANAQMTTRYTTRSSSPFQSAWTTKSFWTL